MEDRLEKLMDLIGAIGARDNAEAWKIVHEEMTYLREQIERIGDHLHDKFGERP